MVYDQNYTKFYSTTSHAGTKDANRLIYMLVQVNLHKKNGTIRGRRKPKFYFNFAIAQTV